MDVKESPDPLVHNCISIQELLNEYKENETFYKKIKALGNMSLYRIKRDGDCFYRALCFGWLWTLMHQTASDSEKNIIEFSKTTELLQKSGFELLSYEDLYEETLLALSLLKPDENQDNQAKEKELLTLMNIPEKSNAIVVYFRFLTSAYIKQNAHKYAPFLDVPSVADVFTFCQNTIECIGKEADHVMINALSKALQVCINIYYIDRSDSDHAKKYEFTVENENPITICLLYRPGHYDFIIDK
ncbi:hypothetical protein T552_00828 [Pneumocystis carinii B80]|uniref:ubiquitinyl hydrolase 1 n=1 Tax=Pneumocystis carinii (strain B80) TaxID=1408658 RepID=A0A0W4ZPQ5_PNEC8|nr:hypothetical protein T552_00828 [Pneumocystis carinii B80]KTW30355.1 hypothetical protein T552_00828 [Pneumocystis carinii B80]